MHTEELLLIRLTVEDRRYPLDAYRFIQEALRFAQEELSLGSDVEGEGAQGGTPEYERHLTGQEFCDAIRVYALQQYGYLALNVLHSMGLRSTRDFGNLVYNMIGIGIMRKSRRDRPEHFHDIYDFETAFRKEYVFDVPK